MWKHRTQEARIGSPRSGKTFGAEVNALNYLAKGHGVAVVYNRGMPGDWSHFETVRPLTVAEHVKYFFPGREAKAAYKLDPKFLYFQRPNGDIYHFSQLVQLYWGRGVCIQRTGAKDDDKVFRAIYDYVGCAYVFFDDIATLVKHGLKTYMSQLLSSQNHAGKYCGLAAARGKGVDISLMFHALDAVNAEVWRYLTHVTLYRTTYAPKRSFLDNPELADELLKAWGEVRKLPRYTAISYFLQGDELEREIITPQQVLTLKNNIQNGREKRVV